MQREIKFRAWDGSKMQNSDEFSDIRDKNDIFRLSRFFAAFSFHKDWPLMQYTGLKDKNGKEIYEGDIVQLRGISKWRVDWSITLCRWMIVHDANYPRGFPLNLSKVTVDKLEIIGNIYENKELLK